jgi:hypothetical protein
LHNVAEQIVDEMEANKREMEQWKAELPAFADVDAIYAEADIIKKRFWWREISFRMN